MIDKANVKNIYRLSPIQGGMLFHALYHEGEAHYFEQGVYRLDGPLDATAFQQAWNLVVERHDALRTAFVLKGVPEPLQVVLRKRPLEFSFHDFSAEDASTARQKIAEHRVQDKAKGFDLTRDPLLRMVLFSLSEECHVMVMSFHHIIMDGWCQGILAREFVAAYQSIVAGAPVRLPAAPQYRDFIRWIERQDKDAALQFWKERLDGFTNPTYFPRRAQNTPVSEEGNAQQVVNFTLTAEETDAIAQIASNAGVTFGTAVQGLWGILLGKLNNADDAVFLATVSGRPADLDNAGNIVGLFINAVPVRVRFTAQESLADVLARLHRENGESGPYHFAPLAEVQANSSLKRDLANTLLVFENYPFASEKDDGPFTITQEDIDERTHYDLTVQVHPGEELGFGVAFNPSLVDPTLVENIAVWFKAVAAAVRQNPKVQANDLFLEAQGLTPKTSDQTRGQTQVDDSDGTPIDIVLAATFTAEPVLPALTWWLQKANVVPRINVAEYNQVFQQLLDPNSTLASLEPERTGYGLLLVRPEDWIRDLRNEQDDVVIAHLHSTYADYLQALTQFSESAVLIHVLLPTNVGSYSESVASVLRELEGQIVVDLESISKAVLLDARDVAERYALPTLFDPIADEAGHVPYITEANAAIGTAIARKVFSRVQHSFKVIAVDCDNTLWDGIVGEDGVDGCHVFGGYRTLQEFLVERYKEGYLIVLNSKNNENDVWEVFDKNPDMILRREHVVAWRINWRPKSGNLQEMAEELNLGLNSFIFIDDSGVECAEVRENAPDVLTLRVPKNHQAIPRFLQHIWALDKWQVTEEDQKRSAMYKAERGRQQEQQESTSLEEFLKSLDLQIKMGPVGQYQVPRASQLTQRTNQFNISTIRRDESQIQELMADENHVCWVVTVEDRFGEYGIVGLIICRREEQTLVVDTLLLSCRVLGRGVEEAILTGMRNYSKHYCLNHVEALFVPTKKNAPGLRFLETWDGERIQKEDGSILFRRSVESLPDGVPFGNFEYRTEPLPAPKESSADVLPKASSSVDKLTQVSQNRPANGTPVPATPATSTDYAGWDVDLEELREKGNLLHLFYYYPLAFSTGTRLSSLPELEESREGAGTEESATEQAEYIAPSTQDERELVGIYEDVLRVEGVGLRDNFFERGGHSLTAVELLSRVHRAFQTEISLRAIFDNPTPEELLRLIRTGTTVGYEPIEALPKLYHYDLSHAQRRLWVLDNIQSDGSAYVMGGANLLEGQLDISVLEKAFHGVIHRHESLRTGIILVHGEPRQRVFDEVDFSIEHVDLSRESLSPTEEERAAMTIIHERERLRFDLSAPPLLRGTLIKLSEERHILALFMHHIIGDGWSYPVFVRELTTLYQAYINGNQDVDSLLPPLRVHYKDYAVWQKERLKSDAAKQDEAYWLERLAGPLPVLELPTDFPHSANPNYEGASRRITLQGNTLAGVHRLCKAERTTLFMFLLASVRSLLWNYTRQRDMVVGVPVAGRDHPDLVDQIGFYVNTLPLRGGVNPEASFAETLRSVREEVLESFTHASYPFDLIVSKLDGLERNTGRSPVFDVMVALQNNRDAEGTIQGLHFRPFGEEAGAGKFDLVFNFNEVPDGLECTVEYRTSLFKDETIAHIGKNLEQIIERAVASPEQELRHLVALYEDIRAEATTIATTELPQGTLLDWFEKTAIQYANKVALQAGEEQLTYSQLKSRSDSVAAALIKRGIQKGDIVAGVLPRSPDLVTAMLGVMKAGALWLPIDPTWPQSRIDMILEDSKASIGIVQNASTTHWSGTQTMLKALLKGAEGIELPIIEANDSAYVIYTSGSTGKPKGVRVAHQSFLNMVLQQIQMFAVTHQDNVLQFASPAFDASLSETFMALLPGATLVLSRSNQAKDTEAFLSLMESSKITVATIPPVYLRALSLHPLPGLRVLITAGEEAPVKEVLFHASYGIQVFNAYGPTECSVCATVHEVDPTAEYGERIPVGSCIGGVGAFVADDKTSPLPLGAAGELILYGHGLAEGYLHNKELTQDRFIFPEWLPGVRCYRTGDRVRMNAEGEFDFLGRVDEQVKIRGYRVEPEEARQALLEIPEVQDAVVIPVGSAGDKQLIGFVCAESELDLPAVRQELVGMLPPFLVPQILHGIDRVPITPNGKVDRKFLAQVHQENLNGDMPDSQTAGPRTPEEAVLVSAFSEVLSREVRSVHDNFFTMGGDSIKAIQIRGALRHLGYEVRSRDIYEGQTIAGIAPFLRSASSEEGEEGYPEGAAFSTPIVDWFSTRLDQDDAQRFILPLVVDCKERVQVDALEQALIDLEARHSVLRAVAQVTDGRTTLQIPSANSVEQDAENATEEPERIAVQILDVRDNPDQFASLGSIVDSTAAQFAFDGNSPLYRSILVQGTEQDVLALVLHHFVVDAISQGIILNDLNTAYTARLQGEEPVFGIRSASYSAWAKNLETYCSSIPEPDKEQWRTVVQQAQAAPLPFAAMLTAENDNTQTTDDVHSGHLSIQRPIAEKFLRLRRRGIEVHHILLVALARTFAKLVGHNQLAVLMESHGRNGEESLDLTGSVGWFTAVYPMLLNTGAGSHSVLEELKAVRESLQQISGREAEYSILRYKSDDETLQNDLRVAPQVSFNYLGEQLFGTSGKEERQFSFTEHPLKTEPVLLSPFEINAMLMDGIIQMVWSCGGGLTEAFSAEFKNEFTGQINHIAEAIEGSRAEFRVICMPVVGGTTASFDALSSVLPDTFETLTFELPGHGKRIDETPLDQVPDIVDDILSQLDEYADEPYIMFGHSLGALLGFEVARKLCAEGRQAHLPQLLVCSGAPAPFHLKYGEMMSELPDYEFIRAYHTESSRRGETPPTGVVLEKMIVSTRADYMAVENYHYAKADPLPTPLVVLRGSEEAIIIDMVHDWADEAGAGMTVREVQGGHDFPFVNAQETVDVILQELQKIREYAPEHAS